MKKDEFNKIIENKSDLDFTFEEIEQEIDYARYEKGANKKKQPRFPYRKVLVPTFAALSIVGLVLGLTIGLNKESTSTLSVTNLSDLQLTYEKNTRFIKDGIMVSEQTKEAQNVAVSEDAFVVDDSAYKFGVPGNYDIVINLKSNNKASTKFSVEVVDDNVVEILLDYYRNEYFIGEEIINQDVFLYKIGETGAQREAKINEYVIDDSAFDNTKEGTYPLTVTLKSNPEYFLNYEVSVVAMENVNLDGRYGYIESHRAVGQPALYCFDIIDGEIISHYSEVLMRGPFTVEVLEDRNIIRTAGSGQEMIYLPATRTLVVSGIAGDPDMPCTRLNRTDTLFTIQGNITAYDALRTFTTLNGFLRIGTYNYFNNMYGGVYLDEAKENPVLLGTEIENGAVLYVGFKPNADIEKPFLGVWLEESGFVYATFDEDHYYYSSATTGEAYSIEQIDENTLLIRIQEAGYYYFIAEDRLEYFDLEDQISLKKLTRFNQESQIVVTLITTYSSMPLKYAVYQGEAFNPVIVANDKITVHVLIDYAGEPLFEDVTIKVEYTYNVYMMDLAYKTFGTLDHYFLILPAIAAGKENFGYAATYYYEEYHDFVLVAEGRITFNSYLSAERIITFNLYDDTTTLLEKATLGMNSRVLQTSLHEYQENLLPFAGQWFLGSYQNDGGPSIIIRSDGRISFDESNYEYCYISALSDTSATIRYFDDDLVLGFSIATFEITNVDGVISLNYKGNIYTRSV